jgi:hypothetical protein
MSVDYEAAVIYGYKLNTVKFHSYILGRKAVDPKYDARNWIEEQNEWSNCEFIITNQDIYFGIRYENRLCTSLMVELEADRCQEIEDEFVRIFGENWFFLIEEGELVRPTFHAVVIMN